MMNFVHPGYLYFLLAIPFFYAAYALICQFRKKKRLSLGLPWPVQENTKFTISNGWFVLSVGSLIFAILAVGLARPIETEEEMKQMESKNIELVLAFDPTNAAKMDNSPVEVAKEKITDDFDNVRPNSGVGIGALSWTDMSIVQTISSNFGEVEFFLRSHSMDNARISPDFMAEAISTCTSKIRWGRDEIKHAIVLISDAEEITPEQTESAVKAAKAAAAKTGIYTYVIGLGDRTDDEDMIKIASAGKGIFIKSAPEDLELKTIVKEVKKNKKLTFVSILNYFLLSIVFLVTPSLVIYLCKKYKWMSKIGPIIFLYAVGMLLGNVTINGASLFPDQLKTLQDIFSSAMVPLAIPLMLYSCTLRKEEIGKHFKAMITGVIAVVFAVVAGYFLFGKHLPESNKLAGMLTGVYTGGTINMAAIKESLQASKETYILIQTYDIIICLTYLIFLMTFGIKLFRKFLPFDSTALVKKKGKKSRLTAAEEQERLKLEKELTIEEIGFRSIFTKEGFRNTLVLLGATILGVVLSAGITLLICGGSLNMTVFYLLITTFGIIGSFMKNIHDRKQHYNLGLYCIYIFSLVIATMADIDKLVEAITTDYWLPAYMVFAVFGSLLLHALFAKIFKVDADTMVITSVTYINSPAFVPMIAASMRNKNVIIPGLTIGIIGFAVGNYLGTFIAYIL